MTIPLRQSTSSQEIPLGFFLDSTNGDTEETGLTIAVTDIYLWKQGATVLINKNTGGATHMNKGVYYCTLDATDTNTVGALYVYVHVAGALAVKTECTVYPANVYDSLIAGTDTIQSDVTQWLGTAAATPTVAGVPEVDVTYWLGTTVTANVAGQPTVDVTRVGASTQSLIDLKDFADAGYDPVTNKVQGVVLADTVTTATNLTNAPTNGDLTATMKTSVNDQVVDVIRTDTTSEMSQGAPPVDPTMEEMIAYLYFKMRNKQETTSSEDAIYDDAGTTKLFKSAISDDGTTFTKQEYGTGA